MSKKTELAELAELNGKLKEPEAFVEKYEAARELYEEVQGYVMRCKRDKYHYCWNASKNQFNTEEAVNASLKLYATTSCLFSYSRKLCPRYYAEVERLVRSGKREGEAEHELSQDFLKTEEGKRFREFYEYGANPPKADREKYEKIAEKVKTDIKRRNELKYKLESRKLKNRILNLLNNPTAVTVVLVLITVFTVILYNSIPGCRSSHSSSGKHYTEHQKSVQREAYNLGQVWSSMNS